MKIATLLISGVLMLGMNTAVFAAEEKKTIETVVIPPEFEYMPSEVKVNILKQIVDKQPTFTDAVKALRSLISTDKELNELIKKYVIPDLAKKFPGEAQLLIFKLSSSGKLNPFILTILLGAGVDLNKQNQRGDTALILAINNRDKNIAKLLIDKGADLNIKGNYGSTALIEAAYNKDKDIAKLLINSGKADLNIKNNHGDTALMAAIYNDAKDIAKLLIDKGADLNIKDYYGGTALMRAIDTGDKDTAKLLIDKGSDLNIKNNRGYTALDLARKYNKADIIKMIEGAIVLKKIKEEEIEPTLVGVPKDIKGYLIPFIISEPDFAKAAEDADGFSRANKEYRTLVIEALKKRFKTVQEAQDELFKLVGNGKLSPFTLKILIAAGAGLDIKDSNSNTALILAINEGDEDIAKLLIDKGADLNMQDRNGYTALMLAVINNDKDMVKLLIDEGADLDIKKQGYTALDMAREYNKADIIKMIEDAAKKTKRE